MLGVIFMSKLIQLNAVTLALNMKCYHWYKFGYQ